MWFQEDWGMTLGCALEVTRERLSGRSDCRLVCLQECLAVQARSQNHAFGRLDSCQSSLDLSLSVDLGKHYPEDLVGVTGLPQVVSLVAQG